MTIKLGVEFFYRAYGVATAASLAAFGFFGEFWWVEVPPLAEAADLARLIILVSAHMAGLYCLAAWLVPEEKGRAR